jgi:hypothetical protein
MFLRDIILTLLALNLIANPILGQMILFRCPYLWPAPITFWARREKPDLKTQRKGETPNEEILD